jgi:MYXO-CTERM domain-containing protein
MVTLSDSTTYVGYSNGPADFIGFYSSNLLISSLSIQASGEGVTHATVDNLYFATVPAPGAIALIGLAGFAARRRERRA